MDETEFHAFVLAKWRERELTFPPRVRRMNPDDMDRAIGTWAKFVRECREAKSR